MKKILPSFVSGVVFALGLGIAGMTRPSKVIGFLDFAGDWDPSLGLVMAGAMAVYMIAYYRSKPMKAPFLAPSFYVPARTDLDLRLITGAALFGVGWGLAGFCPGPAITSLLSGALPVLDFVIAMIAGMILYAMTSRWLGDRRHAPARLARLATDS